MTTLFSKFFIFFFQEVLKNNFAFGGFQKCRVFYSNPVTRWKRDWARFLGPWRLLIFNVKSFFTLQSLSQSLLQIREIGWVIFVFWKKSQKILGIFLLTGLPTFRKQVHQVNILGPKSAGWPYWAVLHLHLLPIFATGSKNGHTEIGLRSGFCWVIFQMVYDLAFEIEAFGINCLLGANRVFL